MVVKRQAHVVEEVEGERSQVVVVVVGLMAGQVKREEEEEMFPVAGTMVVVKWEAVEGERCQVMVVVVGQQVTWE